MSVIALLLESIVSFMGLVRCPEFGGCALFGTRKCITSTGIAVGKYINCCPFNSNVRYWE